MWDVNSHLGGSDHMSGVQLYVFYGKHMIADDAALQETMKTWLASAEMPTLKVDVKTPESFGLQKIEKNDRELSQELKNLSWRIANEVAGGLWKDGIPTTQRLTLTNGINEQEMPHTFEKIKEANAPAMFVKRLKQLRAGRRSFKKAGV